MKYQRSPNSPVPAEPPPPELTAAVHAALGLDRKATKPEMADALPDGLSEANPPPPGLKLPEPLPRVGPPRPADETMPAFGPIERVNQGTLAQMGWLTTRLMLRFPHIAEHQWSGRLRMYMVDNAYLFIRSAHAAALATVVRDPFRAKAQVQLLFCMHSEHGNGAEERAVGERHCILLLREVLRWAKTLGADEIHRLADCCDLSPSKIENALAGAERRDEIVVRIR
jgi:hypothetical protein